MAVRAEVDECLALRDLGARHAFDGADVLASDHHVFLPVMVLVTGTGFEFGKAI